MPDSAVAEENNALAARAEALLASVQTLEELERARVDFLGRKGQLTAVLAGLRTLDPSQRKKKGAEINRLKDWLVEEFAKRHTELTQKERARRLASEGQDLSLPARPEYSGILHPTNKIIEETVRIFSEMGFQIAEGPDIEDDFHNFSALNMPPEHPARQMHDTFYLRANAERTILRTHTSPVQIRTLCSTPPPFRIIAPGRTYRSDSDQTHTPMFHQIEGLVVDTKTHFGHLKGCLTEFLEAFFDIRNPPLRFRPSYFPFTEPSAELDVQCRRSHNAIQIGEGNRLAGNTGMRHGAPRSPERMRSRPATLSGFCLWSWDRAFGNAEIWLAGFAPILRFGH